MEIAAIDMGTNSFHMVVADVGPRGDFTVVAREKEMLRLGDDVARTGSISAEKIDEALRTLARFTDLCSARGVRRIFCCATSATREADNGSELCDRVERELGLNPRVISGTEEAELIYRAIRHSSGLSGRHLLGIDIGGGSVEVMLGDAEALHWSVSLPLGIARMAAGLSGADPPKAKDRARLSEAIAATVDDAAHVVRSRGHDSAIGTSGTIEDLARAIATTRTGAVPVSLSGFVITYEALQALDAQLWRMKAKERAALDVFDPRRVDIAHVGSTLLLTLMEMLRVDEVMVGTWALREGILLAAIAEIAPESDRVDPARARRDSVLALLQRCGSDEWHARHVARLSVELYDGLAPLLGARDDERLWLEEAALLHDIGLFVAASGHHRHSAYLIQHAGLRGMSPDEVNIVASVARAHRGGPPKVKHETYAALDDRSRLSVEKLAAVLRVVDGLDRGHGQRVSRLTVRPADDSVVIEVDGSGPPDLELWGARRKRALLEQVLGSPVEVVPRGFVHHPAFAAGRGHAHARQGSQPTT